jgi:hypothetical protein
MNDIVVMFRDEQYLVDSLLYETNNVKCRIVGYKQDFKELVSELSTYDNVTFILGNIEFDSLAKTGNPLDASKHNITDVFYNDNNEAFVTTIDKFSRQFNNTKIILYDNNMEFYPTNSPIKNYISDWLQMSRHHYLISSRMKHIVHPRALTGLTYLPLILAYFSLNFHEHPKLDYVRPLTTDYDFITFLGFANKTDKVEFRFNFLKSILGTHMHRLKHEKDSNSYVNDGNFGIHRKTNYHFTNLLQSLSVKVQLIFETFSPSDEFIKDTFFTEKTMKLFLLPHPYFLFAHGSGLTELEKFGFKFPTKCFTFEDYKNQINEIVNDVDGWIDKHSDIFYHNHQHFYKLINSDNLPHHSFMKSILFISKDLTNSTVTDILQ